MNSVLSTFKIVGVAFACAAVFTGAQAMVDPVGFSRSFGLPIVSAKDAEGSKATPDPQLYKTDSSPARSYVALMGVRQLATGIILLTFAYQGKWTEMATILSIIGIIVAGTDGFYLSRSGAGNQARFHAIPGALIAILAGTTIFTSA